MNRLVGSDFWGTVRALEPANVRPDLRNVRTFAEDLDLLLRQTAAIQADPFKHLPGWMKPAPLSTIARVTSRNIRAAGRWAS